MDCKYSGLVIAGREIYIQRVKMITFIINEIDMPTLLGLLLPVRPGTCAYTRSEPDFRDLGAREPRGV